MASRKSKGKNKKATSKSIPKYLRKLSFFILAGVVLLVAFFIIEGQFFSSSCANSISCIKDLSGEIEDDTKAVFMGRNLVAPKFIASAAIGKQVLGEKSEEKHIYVDLSKQRLYAYQGEQLVYEFPVSTGKWGRTPTGDFKIWIKLVATRMSGGSGNDYYNLPNVPYTMFYYNDEVPKSRGYSIHGAYWHNNFGYPMSHGCVNMRQEDAKVIFEWATPVGDARTTYATEENPGTIVTVYGEAPDM